MSHKPNTQVAFHMAGGEGAHVMYGDNGVDTGVNVGCAIDVGKAADNHSQTSAQNVDIFSMLPLIPL